MAGGCGLTVFLHLFLADAPAILQAPESQFVLEGETAMFTVMASGFNLSFQWLREDVSLQDDSRTSGSRTPNLTISNVSMADFGNYSVRVSNLVTNITSDTAPLGPCKPLPPSTSLYDMSVCVCVFIFQ